MSRQLSDLQGILGQMTAENRKLLALLDAQHAAMKSLDIGAMTKLAGQQEEARLRIAGLDNRRRILVSQIAISLKVSGDLTITRLSELLPPHAAGLLKCRNELRDVIEKISRRTNMSAKLSSAVLGHLNTVSRLIAGAVERAGIYTKQGVRRVATRIGVMDAVG
jgi:hypothetical protein